MGNRQKLLQNKDSPIPILKSPCLMGSSADIISMRLCRLFLRLPGAKDAVKNFFIQGGFKMAKKILVIDDEELIIRSLAKLLEKNNFEVFVIKRGQDALVMVEEEDFDLIISDIKMPGMNGVELTERVLKVLEDRGSSRPSIIFITGYADVELEQEAKRLNPAAYIYKPFDVKIFVERIKEILK